MEKNRTKINWKEAFRENHILRMVILGTVLVSAVINCFGIWSYNQYRRELIETEQKQLLTMAETVGSSLVNFVGQELDNIDLYFSLLESGNADNAPLLIAERAAAAFLTRGDELYTAMTCYKESGQPIFQRGSMDFEYSWVTKDKTASICGKRFCGDHYEMYISRKFSCSGERYTAVYAVNLDKIYSRIVEPVKIGQGGYSIVKDSELSIIMHHAPGQIGMDAVYDRREKYPQLDLTDLFEWIHMQKMQPEGAAVIQSYVWDDENLAPEKRIVAYTTIRLPGETWIVNSTLPFQELNGPLSRMLLRLIGMSGLFILLAGGFVFVMTRSLMRLEGQKKEITYLKEINEGMELLRRKEEEIQHYQRIQSIGQLSSHIAHEFNNYLTPIMLYCGILKEDRAISTENHQMLDGILNAAEQAANLSRKLLDFSRQDTGVGVTVMNLTDEVKRAVDMVRCLTPEQISFHAEIYGQPLYVRGKSGMAEQILMNLCNNAYHAMENREGNLTVCLIRTENINMQDANMQDTNMQDTNMQDTNVEDTNAGWACLSVSDTGCGIRKEALDKIFEPFYTTKRSGKGTGLGLSVIQNVMLSVGGRIQIESELGKGTVFYLYFPLVDQQKETEPRVKPKKSKRMIVVDDDPEVRKGLEAKLKRQYRWVKCFSHPAAVLAKLQNHKDYCDCILTDYDMPSINGLEFAELVRKLNPEIQLILMSGMDREAFGWYLKNGFIDEFILKSDLVERLDSGL